MYQEQTMFQAFVVPAKKQRYADLFGTKRGREKIRLSLDHFKDLDPSCCRKMAPGESSTADILRILNNLGAPPNCYVMSSDSQLDARELDLSEALEDVVGRGMGAFISCIPGELAYFEGEERYERYICRRKR